MYVLAGRPAFAWPYVGVHTYFIVNFYRARFYHYRIPCIEITYIGEQANHLKTFFLFQRSARMLASGAG